MGGCRVGGGGEEREIYHSFQAWSVITENVSDLRFIRLVDMSC